MNEPIRILHVLGSLDCGGIENLIMNIYKKIDRTKIQFDFVIHKNEKCFFFDEIQNMGGRIFVAPQLTRKSFFEYRKWWKDFLYKNNYKIIHSHMIYTAKLYIKLAKHRNIKVILHSHYTVFSGDIKKKFAKKIMTLGVGKYSDYMFACSNEAGVSIYGKRVTKDNRYLIINNGIECSKYGFNIEIRKKIREQLNMVDNTIFGHVGSFSEAKNHAFLIDVFQKIKERKKDAKLLLVGDGSLKEEIFKKIREKNLENDVVLLGVRKDVNEILMAMDAFIFPSLYEGLGIAIVEAQATGLKCIVSDTVPSDVNVSNNVNFMSLEKSALAWAEDILKSINVENNRKNALKSVEENGYDICDIAKELEEIYLNLVKGAKK